MKQKLNIFLVVLFSIVGVFTACDDDATYGDMRKSENKAIKNFIKNGRTILAEDGKTVLVNVEPITEISEEEFEANDSTTDVSKNEYVLFAGSGVYMQIVRKGKGEKIKDGESLQVVCRFTEFNISEDTLQLCNNYALFEQLTSSSYEQYPEVMNVTNSSGTYSASFSAGGLMYASYGSAVPNGWTMALPFINLGRQDSEDSEIAKIRLIVPSTEGHSYASSGVYACFYEITMQRGR